MRVGAPSQGTPQRLVAGSWSTDRSGLVITSSPAEPFRCSSRTSTGSREHQRRRGAQDPRRTPRPLHPDRRHLLANPTPHQRSVLNEVAALADQVVVMTEAARARLCDGFDVDPFKVETIAHGAAIPHARVVPDRVGRPVILTWGLIGPARVSNAQLRPCGRCMTSPCGRVTWWPASSPQGAGDTRRVLPAGPD